MMARTNQIILVVGQRGAGKTDFIKERVFKMTQLFPKVVIFDEFDSDTWHNLETHLHPERMNFPIPKIDPVQFKKFKSGIARIIAETDDLDEYFSLFKDYAKNTFLVLEDASRFLMGHVPPLVMKLIYNTKQNNVDLMLAFHSLTDIPPKMARNCNYIVLFKTEDHEVPKKFGKPKIVEAFNRLQENPNQYANELIRIN